MKRKNNLMQVSGSPALPLRKMKNVSVTHVKGLLKERKLEIISFAHIVKNTAGGKNVS